MHSLIFICLFGQAFETRGDVSGHVVHMCLKLVELHNRAYITTTLSRVRDRREVQRSQVDTGAVDLGFKVIVNFPELCKGTKLL